MKPKFSTNLTKKKYIFFVKLNFMKLSFTKNLFFFCLAGGPRDLLPCFMEKIKFQLQTAFIFIFYCGTVSRETGEKIAACFTIFLAQK